MEERIEGWKNISKAFPCAHSTFMANHAYKMLKAGYVFKSHVTRHTIKKSPLIWTFPTLIFAYMSAKQIRDNRV